MPDRAPAERRNIEELDLVARFLHHLVHERRLAARTVDAYRSDLQALVAALAPDPVAAAAPHDIRRVVSTLHGRGLSGRSIARMLSAWRGFYRYLVRDHGHTANPCAGLRAPKAPKRLPNALSPDDACRLVELPGEHVLAVRDRAMLELMYSSGLRLSELTGLDWSAFDWNEGVVRVTGKGSKTRVVPVGRRAIEALRAWREQRVALVRDDQPAVFVNRHGGRLSGRTVEVRVRRAGLALGLPARVHPHALRHSFASHVLQSSGDLRAVQEMLGHASISTTQVYTHLDFQHLAKVYDAAHPRAKKKRT